MHDDLEHLVERSLDERAGRLTPGHGSLADVLARAERRQQRRRATAVVGSLAVAAVGLIGLSVVQGADEPMQQGAGLDAAFATTAPATALGGGYLDAYRCTQELDVPAQPGDDGAYYATCEYVLLIDGVPVELVPTTVGIDVPVTWIECPPWDPADADASVATTTPACGTAPATTVAYCEQSDGGVTLTVPCVTSPPIPSVTTAPFPDPTVSTTTVVAPSGVMYVVEPGDSLMSIAGSYQISVDSLAFYNGWDDGLDHALFPGDVIQIPPDAVTP